VRSADRRGHDRIAQCSIFFQPSPPRFLRTHVSMSRKGSRGRPVTADSNPPSHSAGWLHGRSCTVQCVQSRRPEGLVLTASQGTAIANSPLPTNPPEPSPPDPMPCHVRTWRTEAQPCPSRSLPFPSRDGRWMDCPFVTGAASALNCTHLRVTAPHL
jgi:hypothetical protein